MRSSSGAALSEGRRQRSGLTAAAAASPGFCATIARGETNEHIHSSAAEAMLVRYLIGRPGDDVAESFGKAAAAAAH